MCLSLTWAEPVSVSYINTCAKADACWKCVCVVNVAKRHLKSRPFKLSMALIHRHMAACIPFQHPTLQLALGFPAKRSVLPDTGDVICTYLGISQCGPGIKTDCA